MPAQPFTVHADPDDLARPRLAVPVDLPSTTVLKRDPATHHGAADDRQAARERSGRARAGRAASAGTGRSYAFRRS